MHWYGELQQCDFCGHTEATRFFIPAGLKPRPTPRAGGIAVGSDKPVLSGSDNSTVSEAGSPALR